MSDEIDKPIPECGQCEDYFKVQQIKTARIKELQKQLEVAVEYLKDIKLSMSKSDGDTFHCEAAYLADEALKKIEEMR